VVGCFVKLVSLSSLAVGQKWVGQGASVRGRLNLGSSFQAWLTEVKASDGMSDGDTEKGGLPEKRLRYMCGMITLGPHMKRQA
jgi:hypothetical protein